MSEPNQKLLKAENTIILALFFVGIVGIITIALPSFFKARSTGATNACINNLRQIDSAAKGFALEQVLTNGQAINFPNDLTPYLKLNSEGKISPCPSGGTYHLAKVGEIPTCSLGSTVTPAHVLP